MSTTELDRLKVVQRVAERSLTGVVAAQQLGVTPRQMGRLLKSYRLDGAAGLVSKKRGKPSHRAYSSEFKERVLSIIRGNYADFGPTLAAEKLRERHDIELSDETLRRWLIDAGIWVSPATGN